MPRPVPAVLVLLLLSLPSLAATRVPGAERLLTTPLPSPAGGSPYVTGAASNGRDFAVAWQHRNSYYVTRLAPLAPRVERAPVRLDIAGAPLLAAVGDDYLVVWKERDAFFSGRLAETGAVVSRHDLGPAGQQDGLSGFIANDTHTLVVVHDGAFDSTRIRLLDSRGEPAGEWVNLGSNMRMAGRVHPAIAADANGFLVVQVEETLGAAHWLQHVVIRRLTPQGFAGELRVDTSRDRIHRVAAVFDGTDYLVVLYNEWWTAIETGETAFAGTRGLLVAPDLTPRSGEFVIAGEEARLRSVFGRPGGSLLFFEGSVIRVDHATRTASAPAPSATPDAFVTDGRSLLGYSVVYDSTTSPRILVRWLRASTGAPLSEPFLLSTGSQEQRRPAAALGREVDLVVWEESNAIRAARLLPDGTVLDSSPLRLSTEGIPSLSPAVTFDGEHFVVVWCEVAGDRVGRVMAMRIAADGVPVDTVPSVVHNAWAETPAIAHDGDTTLVTWVGYGTRTSTHGPGRDVFGARLNRSGFVLDSVPLLISRDAWDHFHPDVVAGDGEFLVGWQTYRWFGHHSPIATGSSVAIVTAGGTVHEPVVLTPLANNTHTSPPQVAWNGSEFFASWHANGLSYAQRITPGGTATRIPLTSVAEAAFLDGSWHVLSGQAEDRSDFANDDIRGVALDAELRALHLPEIASPASESEPALASNGTRAVLVYRKEIPEPPYNNSGTIVFRLYDTPHAPPPTRRRATRH